MPKHTGPRRQNGPRRRTGCITCKNAHVKCTEERPHCRRCGRLKLSCDYEFTLLWEEDAMQRGIVHGRTGVWSKNGKRTSAGRKQSKDPADMWLAEKVCDSTIEPVDWTFVNFEVEDFLKGIPPALYDEDDGRTRCGESTTFVAAGYPQEQPTSFNSEVLLDEEHVPYGSGEVEEEYGTASYDRAGLAPGFDLGIPPIVASFALTNVEMQLMDYYVRSLAPKCSLSLENPYLEVLLPVAYHFAPLRNSLLAAAACQLFYFSGESRYEVDSLRHRSKAIRGLKDHLGRECMDWKSLATMAMFCFRDITDNCEPTWITHLQMGLLMLKELRCRTRIDSDLQNFCEIYFVAHEVMGRTGWDEANGETRVYEWKFDERFREVCVEKWVKM